MKKRYLSMLVAMIFAIPLVLYGAGIVTVKKTERKTYKRVKFSHVIHKKNNIKKCKTCHHKGKVNKSCAAAGCHQGKPGTKKIHKLCISCHKTKGGNAPKRCAQCHKY